MKQETLNNLWEQIDRKLLILEVSTLQQKTCKKHAKNSIKLLASLSTIKFSLAVAASWAPLTISPGRPTFPTTPDDTLHTHDLKWSGGNSPKFRGETTRASWKIPMAFFTRGSERTDGISWEWKMDFTQKGYRLEKNGAKFNCNMAGQLEIQQIFNKTFCIKWTFYAEVLGG